MKGKSIILVLTLLACATFVCAKEDDDTQKSYVSLDFLGIAVGNYQLALEVPIAQDLLLIAEGHYFNWHLGVMPKLTGIFMNYVVSMDPVEYADNISAFINALEIYGGGGTIGLAKYLNRKSIFSTYFAGTLSYTYNHIGLDKDSYYASKEPEALPKGVINIPLHYGSIAGRFGGKLQLGPVALDLFYSLSLNGFNSVKLYRDLGLDDTDIDMADSFSLKLGPIAFMPGSELGLRVSIAF